MSPLAAMGMRGVVAAAGGVTMAAGLFFAFQGEPARLPEDAAADFGEAPSAPRTVVGSAIEVGMVPATATLPSTPAEQPDATAADAVATVAPRPVTQAPAPAPASPGPVSDIPKYTDVAVLGLAAEARLPSGRTFRECVELPPSHEKWPTPVHLYYEGKGKWLVETHVAEVQVLFDEATASFTARNFAPTSPECLKPR